MTRKILSVLAVSLLILATSWRFFPLQFRTADPVAAIKPLSAETVAAYSIRTLPTWFVASTFCDDDRWLACSGDDIRLVGVVSEADRTLKDHADSIQYLPATRSLLGVNSYRGTLTVWDTDTWQARRHLAVEQDTGPEKTKTVEEEEAGENPLRYPKLGRAIASADGRLLAAATYHDHRIKVWSLISGQLVHDLGQVHHGKHIQDLAFSPDGRTLVSVGYDNRVLVLNVADWKPRASWSCPQEDPGRTHDPWLVIFAPDSAVIATASSDAKVRVWDLDGKPRAVFALLPGAYSWIFSAAFSPDGRYLAVGGGFTGQPGLPGILAVWDWQKQREAFRLQPSSSAPGICFSASQKWLAWGSGDMRGRGNIMPWPPPGLR